MIPETAAAGWDGSWPEKGREVEMENPVISVIRIGRCVLVLNELDHVVTL
jgi:hypothetical protein